jgi:hypothetical protein
MLLLKPLKRSRSLVQKSQLSLSLRIQICQLHTRTYVRLLGPCFKTGRMKSFCQHRKTPVLESVAGAAILNRSRSPIKSIESPKALLPPVVFLHNQLMLTTASLGSRKLPESTSTVLRSMLIPELFRIRGPN